MPPDVRRERTIRTVSHTLESDLAQRLREFAFDTRVSESAVIEFALDAFFRSGDGQELASSLVAAGYGLRRRTG